MAGLPPIPLSVLLFPQPLSYNTPMTMMAMVDDPLSRTTVEAAASRLGVSMTLVPDAPAAAGCTEVLPRSAFVQRLPELLA